jgi:chromate transporter
VGSAAEVFAAFLKLGLTSFGGPIAHLGYFHRELIERRRWLDEARYGELVALCQFLPGPASSQLGFALGLIRAGWPGAFAAFIAFTLPSALALWIFAQALPVLDQPVGHAIIHGLKLMAVAVVAQGVWAMAKRLTPDIQRVLIAVAAAALALLVRSAVAQVGIIVIGAVLGLVLCRGVLASTVGAIPLALGRRAGALLLAVFVALLAGGFVIGQLDGPPLLSAAAAFYRTGALVFGGGHVVLPLLQEAVVEPGWVSSDSFLAGYGAAQAIPGPLFSIAAFLGERIGGLAGALIALIAIFSPGFLLVAGALPFRQSLAQANQAARALAGVNAAVVGLLAAALYDPLWTSAVLAPIDIGIVLIALALLLATRLSVLVTLAWCVVAAFASYWLLGS